MSRVRVIDESRLSDVLSRLPGVPRVVVSGNFATPTRALNALDKALAEYRLFMLNAQPGVPDRAGVSMESAFVGPGMRGKRQLRYFPCRLSLVPSLLKESLPPDVVVVHTSAPRDGTVSLGVEVNILPAAIDAVRSRGGLVIAQLNPQMPYTHGDGVLHLDEIDYAIEVDEPLPSPPPRARDEIAERIGGHVAGLVDDGATLQLGIGAVPDAALAALTNRRCLRVWSEMFSDGVLGLRRAGALDPDAPLMASFVFGSAELYDWVDDNPAVRLLRTEKTNDPGLIAKQTRLTSINSALQVDLYGQANANRAHGMIYSGFGGQTDFVVGALHSVDGKAIIALPSWHAKTDTSTVVPCLAGPVTSFQHSFIVSENGVASIWGQDSTAQARQLVDHVAHPRARDGLRAAGRELGLQLT
jgi:acyl-CoA hydrolase